MSGLYAPDWPPGLDALPPHTPGNAGSTELHVIGVEVKDGA